MTRFRLLSVFLALLFGGFVLMPNILQHMDTRFPFAGIEIMPLDAEIHYAARMREVADGYLTVANTFLAYPKEQPYLQPSLPEAGYLLMTLPFFLSLAQSFIVAKCMAAVALFLLMTGFFSRLSGRRYESMAAVTLCLFTSWVFTSPWDIIPFFTAGRSVGLASFSRSINPLWTLPWTLATCWLLSTWYERSTWSASVAAALACLVLLYSYLYAWTFIGMGLALLFCFLLVRKEWRRVRQLLLFGVVFFAGGIPYFLNLWQSLHHPWYPETAKRMGMIVSHAPSVGIWSLVFVCASSIATKQWKQKSSALLLYLALGLLILMNQQVLTGANLVAHHYNWYFVVPFGVTTTLLAAFIMTERLGIAHHLRLACLAIAAVSSVGVGYMAQARGYEEVASSWGQWQLYAKVLQHMDHSLPKDATVYAQSVDVLDLIPIYTSLNVTSSSNSMNYLLPVEQVRAPLLFDLWRSGLTPDQARKRFFTDLRYTISSRIYAIYYREILGGYDRIPDDVLTMHLKAYEQYYSLPLTQKLCQMHVDYVLTAQADGQTSEWQQVLAATVPVDAVDTFTIRRFDRRNCANVEAVPTSSRQN